MTERKVKIALMENFGSDFYYFRLALAKFLINKGFEVVAIVPNDDFSEIIRQTGIRVLTYEYERNNPSPLKTVKTFFSVKRILKGEKFDLLHTFRLQPNIIGTLAGAMCKIPIVFNHVTGLGFAFSSKSFKARIFQILILIIYRISFIFSKTIICQNPDDIETFGKSKLFFPMKKFILIKGSGVNAQNYSKGAVDKGILAKLKNELGIDDKAVVFTIITRLLWQKGIHELVEASRELKKEYPNLRCLIIGAGDEANPHSVNRAYREANSDAADFIGRRSEVRELLALSDVFVLPSYYREGVPRSVLEAMAMSKPIITTTMPGCNLTVENGWNGYLIEPQNKVQLREAMESFLTDFEKISRYGKNSRIKLENEFSDKIVFNKILESYNIVLN